MNNFNISYRGKDYLLDQESLPSFISVVKIDAWLRAGIIISAVSLMLFSSVFAVLSTQKQPAGPEKATRKPAKVELQYEAPVQPGSASTLVKQI